MEDNTPKRFTIQLGSYEIPVHVNDQLSGNEWGLMSDAEIENKFGSRLEFELYTRKFFSGQITLGEFLKGNKDS